MGKRSPNKALLNARMSPVNLSFRIPRVYRAGQMAECSQEQLAVLRASAGHLFNDSDLVYVLQYAQGDPQLALHSLDAWLGQRVEDTQSLHHLNNNNNSSSSSNMHQHHHPVDVSDTSAFPSLGNDHSTTHHPLQKSCSHWHSQHESSDTTGPTQALAAAGLPVKASGKKRGKGPTFKKSQTQQQQQQPNEHSQPQSNSPSYVQTVNVTPGDRNGNANDHAHQGQKQSPPHSQSQLRSISPSAKAPTVQTGDSVREQYTLYRSEASQSARERNRLFEMSTRAFLSGDKKKARELSQAAHRSAHTMWNAHSHASEVLQHERNASLSQAHLPTIDLHTLHVEEALKVLRSFAHDCIAKHGDGVRCHIICGVGKHSKAKASLPSAVVSELQKPGILYTEAAPGTLEVQLHRSQVIKL